MKLRIAFAFICFLVTGPIANAKITSYCVPVKKVDFNPLKEILDGKETAYLMLLRSYISEDEKNPGLLEKFEFSPSGDFLKAQIYKNLLWEDGTVFNSSEAAIGIAKGLLFRPLGEKVKVTGLRDKRDVLKTIPEITGIEIIDSLNFKIHFSSKVQNLKGVLREALSTNSRHNRLWPFKLRNPKNFNGSEIMVIGKNPISISGGSVFVKIPPYSVSIISKNCENSDFSLYPEVFQSGLDSYDQMGSKNDQSILLTLNSSKLTLEQRHSLSRLIRNAFTNLPPFTGIRPTSGFFQEGESGHSSNINWDGKFEIENLRGIKLKIGYSIPAFRAPIEVFAKASNIELEMVPLNQQKDLHATLVSSAIKSGRHIILQDLLAAYENEKYFQNTPKTRLALFRITQKSASTIPTDNTTLRTFEAAAIEEVSLAPIARRSLIAFSRKSAPVALDWSIDGELLFRTKRK